MAAQPQPTVFPRVGTMKTIGKYGPAYEVLGPAGRSSRGDEMVTIRIFNTGEITAYELEDMKTDPEAA